MSYLCDLIIFFSIATDNIINVDEESKKFSNCKIFSAGYSLTFV